MRKYIFILLICIILTSIIYKYAHTKSIITYFQFQSDNGETNAKNLLTPFRSVFSEFDIRPASHVNQAHIIFFTLLTDYQKKYNFLHSIDQPLYIYSLLSIDLLASKSIMYQILEKYNSSKKVNKFTPITYSLTNTKDLEKFKLHYDKNKKYILKSNEQKQKGCFITNKLDYIENHFSDYVVVQEVLQNPYTINGHKINLRQYLLIVVKRSTFNAYLFNDGFMYYTPKKFKKNSVLHEHNITTGYIDRSIYDKNPLTYKEFLMTLSANNQMILKRNIHELFQFICKSYKHEILKYDNNHHTKFMLLGCDVAIDDKLRCKIMEMNKGPDLSYKDSGDSIVKFSLVKSTFGLLNIIPKNGENFIHIL
jgi:hypothetical protein